MWTDRLKFLPWRRRPALVPPPPAVAARDAPVRTFRNFMIAGALLLLALMVGAQMFSGGFTVPFEMARYIKAGPRVGSAQLERDLLAEHGPGQSIGPLFALMSRMGFECRGLVEGADCRFRARRGEDQVLSTLVEIRHDGLLVQAIAVQMSLAAQ